MRTDFEHEGSVRRRAQRLAAGAGEALDEIVAEEVAVALVYNGVSHAVMMATPCDLEDLGRGFSLTEGIVEQASEIYDVELEDVRTGSCSRAIEVRLEISTQRMGKLKERRRSLAGRTGCGLCGVDSLEAVLRPLPAARPPDRVSRRAIDRAVAGLPGLQRINRLNGATHAAGWANGNGDLVVVREDVGRHNALDKLCGALMRQGGGGTGGFIVVTSRCSYEMVHKAATMGAAAIVAVSAPTSLAIETAEQAGLILVAFAREGRLTGYVDADRIEP